MINPDYMKSLVKNNYSINPDIIKLIQSFDNDTYVMHATDNKKYIIKIYRYGKSWLNNLSDYMFEINMLNYLKEKDFPAAYSLKNNFNEYLNIIEAPEGRRYWALFNFLEGSEVKNFNIKKSYNYGQIVSKFHLTLDQYRPLYQNKIISEDSLIYTPYKFIKENIKPEIYKLAGINNLDEYINNLAYYLENYKLKHYLDDWGIIGGDFHGYNHIYGKNGLIYMFDFDIAAYGWRSYDISVYPWSLILRYNKNPKKCQLLINSYLKGYSSQKKISNDSLKMIPIFVQLRHLWFIKNFIITRQDINHPENCLRDLFIELKHLTQVSFFELLSNVV